MPPPPFARAPEGTLRQALPEKRRVGRPRKRLESSSSEEPREQILKAASALFASRGIGEVSMLEIAEQSGLGQSSLYYWYRRKEAIVADLVQQVNRLPLAFAQLLAEQGDGADVQLYRLIQFDVRTVCEFPLEITEVHRFSRRDRSAFDVYFRERRLLTATIQKLIERGCEAGVFRAVDAALCALTIIAQDESVQNWYLRDPRPKVREKLEARPGPREKVEARPGPRERILENQASRYRAEEIAEFVATQSLASLIAAPSRVEAVKKRAALQAG